MVAACVVTTIGSRTSSSPGNRLRRSSHVAPAVRPSHCNQAYAATAAAVDAT